MKKVFISYSKDDLQYIHKLTDHLTALKIDKVIETWYCTELVAGGKWNEDIQKNFEESDIVLFMISSNFMRTPYIHEYEIKKAFEKATKDMNFRIVPIVIDFCDWKTKVNDLTQFSALPYKLRPVCDFKNQNMAWYIIEACIKIMIQKEVQPQGDKWYENQLPQDLKTLYERIVKGEV